MYNWNCKEIISSLSLLNFGQCKCASCNYFIHNIMKDFLLHLGNYLRGNCRNCLKFKARYILFTFSQTFQKYIRILCNMVKDYAKCHKRLKFLHRTVKPRGSQLRTIFWFCRRRCSYARISTSVVVAVSRVP